MAKDTEANAEGQEDEEGVGEGETTMKHDEKA